MGQFSFWGKCRRVYPASPGYRKRAANVGGRMIGASFAALTQWISCWLPIQDAHPARVAYAAGGVAATWST